MSESNTPRTDAIDNCINLDWADSYRLAIKLCAELERELAEAKEAKSAWENEALQSRATIKLLTESTAELAALKERIKNADLIPVDIIPDLILNLSDAMLSCTVARAKEYAIACAKEEAKQFTADQVSQDALAAMVSLASDINNAEYAKELKTKRKGDRG